MAEEEKKENKKEEGKDAKSSKGNLVGITILVVVVLLCGAGGFGLSLIFAKQDPATEETEQVEEEPTDAAAQLLADSDEAKPWIFEMSPIIANLDEPGATRIIRVTFIIEMAAEMDKEKGTEFLEGQQHHLRDWAATYLTGLTLDKVGGSRSRERIKLTAHENFSGILFPNAKSYVKAILIKDYIIQ